MAKFIVSKKIRKLTFSPFWVKKGLPRHLTANPCFCEIDIDRPLNNLLTEKAHFHQDGSAITQYCRILSKENPYSELVSFLSQVVKLFTAIYCMFTAAYTPSVYFAENNTEWTNGILHK